MVSEQDIQCLSARQRFQLRTENALKYQSFDQQIDDKKVRNSYNLIIMCFHQYQNINVFEVSFKVLKIKLKISINFIKLFGYTLDALRFIKNLIYKLYSKFLR